jgi:hypothetical protein
MIFPFLGSIRGFFANLDRVLTRCAEVDLVLN